MGITELVVEGVLGSPAACPLARHASAVGEEASRAPGSVKYLSRIYFLQKFEQTELKKYFATSMFSLDFHAFLDFKGNVI